MDGKRNGILWIGSVIMRSSPDEIQHDELMKTHEGQIKLQDQCLN